MDEDDAAPDGEWVEIRRQLLEERAQHVRQRDVLSRRDRHMSAKANDAVVLIDRALARIDDGTYGTCERCGEAISRDRLEAMPHAAWCIACAADRERNG